MARYPDMDSADNVCVMSTAQQTMYACSANPVLAFLPAWTWDGKDMSVWYVRYVSMTC